MMNLFKLVRHFRIFIDTCTLMHEAAHSCLTNELAPALKQVGGKIIIPLQVVREIENLARLSDTRTAAQAAIALVNSLHAAGVVEYRGQRDDPFADHLFLTIFMRPL